MKLLSDSSRPITFCFLLITTKQVTTLDHRKSPGSLTEDFPKQFGRKAQTLFPLNKTNLSATLCFLFTQQCHPANAAGAAASTLISFSSDKAGSPGFSCAFCLLLKLLKAPCCSLHPSSPMHFLLLSPNPEKKNYK